MMRKQTNGTLSLRKKKVVNEDFDLCFIAMYGEANFSGSQNLPSTKYCREATDLRIINKKIRKLMR